MRVLGRITILATTWALPLATHGPGPARLTLGLVVGFLGIRMVALGEQRTSSRVPRSLGRLLVTMITPGELMVVAPDRVTRPAIAVLRGVIGAGACVALMVIGNDVRIWRWSRALDDLLVFVEVAVGAAGVHDIIVGVAGLAGRSVAGLQDRPMLSASLSQFWARRWNHLVQGNLDRAFFRPYGKRRSATLGTLTAFAASGVMHVLAVLDPDHFATTLGPSAAVMGFFLLHAGLVLGERRLGWNRQPQRPSTLLWARVRTVTLFALLSPLLLDPFACVVHVHGRALGH